MRTFFVLVLILAWLSPLSAEDLAVPEEGPSWRMASAGRLWTYELPVKGGQAPYAWALVEGSLPPGIHLVDLSTVQWGSPSRMGLYGVAAEPGQWPVKLLVTDAEGRTATVVWTLEASALGLEQSNPVFESDAAVEWHAVAAGAAGEPRWALARHGYLPLGLSFSADGILAGRPTLPGRYEVPVEVRDEAGQTLRTVLTLAVYGKETTLPPVAARVGQEGRKVVISLETLPESTLIDIDWGDGNGDPLKDRSAEHTFSEDGSYEIVVVASQRDGTERIEARYSVNAYQVATAQ